MRGLVKGGEKSTPDGQRSMRKGPKVGGTSLSLRTQRQPEGLEQSE